MRTIVDIITTAQAGTCGHKVANILRDSDGTYIASCRMCSLETSPCNTREDAIEEYKSGKRKEPAKEEKSASKRVPVAVSKRSPRKAKTKVGD